MNIKQILISLSISALLLGGCSMSQEPPPDREFDQAEAYPLLESIVTDTIAELPEFPGFGRRRYSGDDCSHLGSEYEGWVSIEIRYVFTGETAKSDQVRFEYPDLLRQMWTEAGYDVHRDDIDAEGVGGLEARRPDGVNLWWWSSADGGVSLTLQSGCVPETPDFDKPDYIPPAGNVPPAEDLARNAMNPPSAVGELDAIVPIQGIPAGMIPFDSPVSFEDQL